MPTSLESQRPIMAPSMNSNRNSKRYSTISTAQSTMSSSTTSTATGERMSDIRGIATGLDRLEQQRLQQQRYLPSHEKSDTLAKIALGAKLERALDRRMANQDAVFRPRTKVISEKVAA